MSALLFVQSATLLLNTGDCGTLLGGGMEKSAFIERLFPFGTDICEGGWAVDLSLPFLLSQTAYFTLLIVALGTTLGRKRGM